MSIFDGIEKASKGPKKATDKQLMLIDSLCEQLGHCEIINDDMSVSEASDLIEELLYELEDAPACDTVWRY